MEGSILQTPRLDALARTKPFPTFRERTLCGLGRLLHQWVLRRNIYMSIVCFSPKSARRPKTFKPWQTKLQSKRVCRWILTAPFILGSHSWQRARTQKFLFRTDFTVYPVMGTTRSVELLSDAVILQDLWQIFKMMF